MESEVSLPTQNEIDLLKDIRDAFLRQEETITDLRKQNTKILNHFIYITEKV
jgi:hypothetical protein